MNQLIDQDGNQKPLKIRVSVCISMMKDFDLMIDDYDIVSTGPDEDGEYVTDIDLTDYDFTDALSAQKLIPDKFESNGWEVYDLKVVDYNLKKDEKKI